MHKGDRKNLRDQGWAENLRYLRNLRGGKDSRRFRSIPVRSHHPRVIGRICEIKGGQEICVICAICVGEKTHADFADFAD